MSRAEEILERIEAEARMIRLEAARLMEAYRDDPRAFRERSRYLEGVADELYRLRAGLYEVNVALRRGKEDNSAEVLRREFL